MDKEKITPQKIFYSAIRQQAGAAGWFSSRLPLDRRGILRIYGHEIRRAIDSLHRYRKNLLRKSRGKLFTIRKILLACEKVFFDLPFVIYVSV